MKTFKEVFNHDYEYKYSAPSRINLIGEHIDYNGGDVLPIGISLEITCLASKRNDDQILLYSNNLDDLESYKLASDFERLGKWSEYPFGILKLLLEKNYKIDSGFELYFDSKIPLGCGLSSSAALLVLTNYVISDLFNLNISKDEIAKLTQESENKYNGVKVGILDQSAIALAKKDHAPYLNCDTFKYEYIPCDFKDYEVVLLYTNKTRKLNESKYNERVEECTKALNILKHHYNIDSLSELCSCDLNNIKQILNDEVLYKRVKHVVTEEERVKAFIDNLKNDNLKELGNILNESHYSLKDDYEVTGLHLDSITQAARKNKYCLGARMTGAGFGGFGIALIKKGMIEEFAKEVVEQYKKETGFDGKILEIEVVDGVRKI